MRPFSQPRALGPTAEAQQHSISARQWAEAVALTAAMAGLILWLAHIEALGGVYGMALALVPGFVGLKHGLMPGAVASLAWGVAILCAGSGADVMPGFALLPVGAAALAAGQARDHFRRSRRELRQQVAEQKTQLEQLYRVYNVLRASHAQLQERLAAESWSLDSAVRAAEQQIAERDLAGAASCLLELLATQARVGAASVYLSVNGQLPVFPTARLGAPEVDATHAMIRAAFQRGTLVMVDRNAQPEHGNEHDVLVALPLITSDGRIVGVVAIHELPFVAFHDVHFALLSTLVTRLADRLAQAAAAARPTPSTLLASDPPSGTTRVTGAPVAVPPRRTKRQSSPGRAHSDCIGG